MILILWAGHLSVPLYTVLQPYQDTRELSHTLLLIFDMELRAQELSQEQTSDERIATALNTVLRLPALVYNLPNYTANCRVAVTLSLSLKISCCLLPTGWLSMRESLSRSISFSSVASLDTGPRTTWTRASCLRDSRQLLPLPLELWAPFLAWVSLILILNCYVSILEFRSPVDPLYSGVLWC